MGTVQVRITDKAETYAKEYGSSVSKGILEMHRRLEIIDSHIVAPPVGEMTISEKGVRRIATAVYDRLEELIGRGM